jgi:hypothetical protein
MSEIAAYMGMWCKPGTSPSEVGVRVAELLDAWQGMHHLLHLRMDKVEWSNPHFIEMQWVGNLATFDGDDLTRLVFLAHDMGIRVDLQGGSRRREITILFHPRMERTGSLSKRHPTLSDAFTAWRRRVPQCGPFAVKPEAP